MKCPKELFEESLIDKENLQKEEETKQNIQKKIAILTEKRNSLDNQIYQLSGMIDYMKNTRNTISFCESEIAILIEQAYKNNRNCLYLPEFYIHKSYGRKVFQKLYCHKRAYASGEDSYSPIGDSFDLEQFKEYLARFCYTVETHEHEYYKCYGSGYIKTISITIKNITTSCAEG